MHKKSLTILDFNAAMELARTDPEAFEQYRQDAFETLIARAAERNRQHLRCLQWRINQERQRASDPTAACVKLYRMIWDSFVGECGLIDTLCNALQKPHSKESLPSKAKVLSFSKEATTERPSKS